MEIYLENHGKAIARVCTSLSRFEIFVIPVGRSIRTTTEQVMLLSITATGLQQSYPHTQGQGNPRGCFSRAALPGLVRLRVISNTILELLHVANLSRV